MSVLLKPANYKLYKHFAQMPTPKIAPALYKFLQTYYSNVITNETYDYIIAEGETPIALIAHMDTVFEKPPSHIFYDPIEEVVWSPFGGVGDDRVGIFLIASIIIEGYRPTIIFTNDEEYGGLGATQLITDYPIPPWKINFCIELDRHGKQDAAFYNCGNEAFTKYITGFGFDACRGLFTDICIICPVWKMAGVNLSVGYVNEHSAMEHWFVEFAADTYKKVIRILEDGEKYYEYIETRRTMICDSCSERKDEIEIFPGILEDGKDGFICTDCVVNKKLQWCKDCGKLFIGKGNSCGRCKMNGTS